jgi:hypothetical protein
MASASQNSGAKAPVPSFARTLLNNNHFTREKPRINLKIY